MKSNNGNQKPVLTKGKLVTTLALAGMLSVSCNQKNNEYKGPSTNDISSLSTQNQQLIDMITKLQSELDTVKHNTAPCDLNNIDPALASCQIATLQKEYENTSNKLTSILKGLGEMGSCDFTLEDPGCKSIPADIADAIKPILDQLKSLQGQIKNLKQVVSFSLVGYINSAFQRLTGKSPSHDQIAADDMKLLEDIYSKHLSENPFDKVAILNELMASSTEYTKRIATMSKKSGSQDLDSPANFVSKMLVNFLSVPSNAVSEYRIDPTVPGRKGALDAIETAVTNGTSLNVPTASGLPDYTTLKSAVSALTKNYVFRDENMDLFPRGKCDNLVPVTNRMVCSAYRMLGTPYGSYDISDADFNKVVGSSTSLSGRMTSLLGLPSSRVKLQSLVSAYEAQFKAQPTPVAVPDEATFISQRLSARFLGGNTSGAKADLISKVNTYLSSKDIGPVADGILSNILVDSTVTPSEIASKFEAAHPEVFGSSFCYTKDITEKGRWICTMNKVLNELSSPTIGQGRFDYVSATPSTDFNSSSDPLVRGERKLKLISRSIAGDYAGEFKGVEYNQIVDSSKKIISYDSVTKKYSLTTGYKAKFKVAKSQAQIDVVNEIVAQFFGKDSITGKAYTLDSTITTDKDGGTHKTIHTVYKTEIDAILNTLIDPAKANTTEDAQVRAMLDKVVTLGVKFAGSKYPWYYSGKGLFTKDVELVIAP